MKIGLPKALLYYRYEYLWTSFFNQLGCEVVTSPDTCQTMLTEGIALSVGECCLPIKLFLGHVASLIGRCDYILVPRFETLAKSEEFCVRFRGLPDIVRNTFPEAPLIGYNLQGHKPGSEEQGFFAMAKALGKSPGHGLKAYHRAAARQQSQDLLLEKKQRELLAVPGTKILLASQPYLIHDPYVGGPLLRILQKQGGVPIFPDRCDRQACRACARSVSADLYWTLNKEIVGAIPLMKEEIDGVLLITAFPCGTDSLVNELALRRVRDLPIAQIILDEQQGEAGLETRIECFMDMVRERKRVHV